MNYNNINNQMDSNTRRTHASVHQRNKTCKQKKIIDWIERRQPQQQQQKTRKGNLSKIGSVHSNGLELTLLPHLRYAHNVYAAPFNWKARSLTFGACILCDCSNPRSHRLNGKFTKNSSPARDRGEQLMATTTAAAATKRVYPTNVAAAITMLLFFSSRKKSNYRNIKKRLCIVEEISPRIYKHMNSHTSSSIKSTQSKSKNLLCAERKRQKRDEMKRKRNGKSERAQ